MVNPFAPKPRALTKELIKKADEEALVSIKAAVEGDPDFEALVALEMTQGAQLVAEKLTGRGFLLASPAPTEAEIMVSLTASLDSLASKGDPLPPLAAMCKRNGVAEALGHVTSMATGTPAAVSKGWKAVESAVFQPLSPLGDAVAKATAESAKLVGIKGEGKDANDEGGCAKDGNGNAPLIRKMDADLSLALGWFRPLTDVFSKGAAESARLVGLKPKALSKALVKKGDGAATAAIASVFGGEPSFERLVLLQLEAYMCRRQAALLVAQNFILASHRPTEAEVKLSLKATASKLCATRTLPKPPKKLTKALMKGGGPAAVAAVLARFPKHKGLAELAHAELTAEMGVFSLAHEEAFGETVEQLGYTLATSQLAAHFVLASPSPTEAEIATSLAATMDVLTRP